MDVFLVVAPVFGTNCTIVAPRPQPGAPDDAVRPCVIVDAGAGVAPGVRDLVREQGLTPRAVLATHGHADHTWDAAALCAEYDVPLWIHARDAYRLADPLGTIEDAPPATGERVATLAAALGQQGARIEDYRAPLDVRTFGTPAAPGADRADGRVPADPPARLDLDGVLVDALHAPGHTQGSTLYLPVAGSGEAAGDSPAVDAASDEAARLVLAGDVLFAGSVGRTDLPGGDGETMRRTLRDVVGTLDESLDVVPGHGPLTTIGRERRSNPYLRGL